MNSTVRDIYVGTCGFPMSRTKYYQLFDTVELNNTFYKILNIEWIRKLKEEAPNGFIFNFKVFQGITHDVTSPTWKKSGIKNYKDLKGKVGYLRPTKEVFEFWEKQEEIAKELDARFLVIQTPKSFIDNETNLKNAMDFFRSINTKNTKYKIGIELRGWKIDNIIRLCEEFSLILIVDISTKEPICDTEEKYYRLHGTYKGSKIVYNHDYSDDELENIKNKVIKHNRQSSFVMFNNIYMLKSAIRFRELLYM